MRLRVLGSGSRGNSALLWVDDALLLIDAGLTIRAMTARLDEARVGFRGIDHVVVTHGHLDHTRSAGILAKRHGARLHCADTIRDHRSLGRAPDHSTLTPGASSVISTGADSSLTIQAVRVPHDCDPTYALRFEASGRVLSLLTDMGEPRDGVAETLSDPHVLMIESNHDQALLANGPYPSALKARVAGPGGHLSNDEMAHMLKRIVGPSTHTIVLVHLSQKNNRPELALEAAHAQLRRSSRPDIRVLTAAQDRLSELIDV